MRGKYRYVSLFLGHVCDTDCRSMDNGSGCARIHFPKLRCLCSCDCRHLFGFESESRRQCWETCAAPLSHRTSSGLSPNAFSYARRWELGRHDGYLERTSSALRRPGWIVYNAFRFVLDLPLAVISTSAGKSYSQTINIIRSQGEEWV